MEHVRKLVLDDADNRKALYERLLYTLRDAPDPWAEQSTQPRLREQFEPLEA
jgi:nitrite reductase (NADH) large subunit